MCRRAPTQGISSKLVRVCKRGLPPSIYLFLSLSLFVSLSLSPFLPLPHALSLSLSTLVTVCRLYSKLAEPPHLRIVSLFNIIGKLYIANWLLQITCFLSGSHFEELGIEIPLFLLNLMFTLLYQTVFSFNINVVKKRMNKMHIFHPVLVHVDAIDHMLNSSLFAFFPPK